MKSRASSSAKSVHVVDQPRRTAPRQNTRPTTDAAWSAAFSAGGSRSIPARRARSAPRSGTAISDGVQSSSQRSPGPSEHALVP